MNQPFPHRLHAAHPFGLVIQGGAFSLQLGNRYGFNGNGMGADIGIDNYDFGPKIHDRKKEKWASLAPMNAQHPVISDYFFELNSPTIVVDQDGNEVHLCN